VLGAIVNHGCISKNELPSLHLSGPISCPACGTVLPGPAGKPPTGDPSVVTRDEAVLWASLPQPIAAALLLAGLLSPRERAAFELLGLGYDNRSIARDLQISERTTKRHITAILKKLKLESRLQAGLAALVLFSCSPQLEPVVPKSYGRTHAPGRH
jgi:DNA-binding CsgD family transcriptional regulator